MFAVTRAARRFEALAAEALAALFFEEKRAVRPSQLAEVFETTRGNISHCLSSLEAKGLVARRVDPEDARAFEIALKPAGKRAAVRVIAAFDQLQRSFEQTAGKRELAQMLTALRKLEEIQ